AAGAVVDQVLTGRGDDVAVDLASVVDLVHQGITDDRNGGSRRGVGLDDAAVVQHGGVDGVHQHGDRIGVVRGGDGAAVGDDEVVAAQHLQADGNATRASVGVDVAAVVHLGREVTGHEDSVGQVAVRVGVNVASVAEGSVAIEAVGRRTHRLAGIGDGIDAAAGRVVHCGVEAEGVGAEGTARDRFRQDVAGVVDAGFAHI